MSAEFDLRHGVVALLLDRHHVLEPHDAVTLRVRLQNHLSELLLGFEPAERVDRVLERLAARRRRLADLPGRDLRILLLDGADHVRRGELHFS